MDLVYTIGRRKSAVARIYVTNGKGNITVNGNTLEEYFPSPQIINKVIEPLTTVDATKEFDLNINVKGGGFKGQAEAIRMALARALAQINADYKPALKAKKMFTRDARVVERKKYGKPKARKSFQFSKR